MIRGTARGMAVLFVVTFCGAIYFVGFEGLHSWADVLKLLLHGAGAAALVAFGWLYMRSPLAQEAQELLGRKTTVVDTHTVVQEKVTVAPKVDILPKGPKE